MALKARAMSQELHLGVFFSHRQECTVTLNLNIAILKGHWAGMIASIVLYLQCLCDDFALYFKDKVDKIQKGLEVERNSVNSNDIIDSCNQSNAVYELSEFPLLSENDMSKLIQGFSAKICLLDCIPTWFVKSNLTTFVPIITKIANVSLSTGIFPAALKHAIISPIIKEPSLDPNNLKNYRPVSNIKF